jgi:hypothetical protein
MPESKINHAPEVHAALAAALSDPDLLENWRRDPLALREVRIDERQIDLDQVRNFIGLVTKVRHNDLRAALPVTFKLIDKAGLSITLFADYAVKAAALRTQGKPTQAQKIAALAEYLSGWLDRDKPAHCLAWDIFRHEYSVLLLRQAQRPVRAQADAVKVRSGTVPRRDALMFHHEMTCRPAEVEAAFRARNYDLAQIPRQRSLYAYFTDQQDGRIRISEIDEATFVILDLADGTRSVGAIAALLREAGVAVQTRQLGKMVQQLVSSGMLVADVAED